MASRPAGHGCRRSRRRCRGAGQGGGHPSHHDHGQPSPWLGCPSSGGFVPSPSLVPSSAGDVGVLVGDVDDPLGPSAVDRTSPVASVPFASRDAPPCACSLDDALSVCGVGVDSASLSLLDGSVEMVVGAASVVRGASVVGAVSVPVAAVAVGSAVRPLRPSPTCELGFAPPSALPAPAATPPATGAPVVAGAGSPVPAAGPPLCVPLVSPPSPGSGAASASDAPAPAMSSPDAIRAAAAAMRTRGATSSPPLTTSLVRLIDAQ